ncbi:MAG: type II secretion system F family protein, partial [Actinomycetes bacterium]
MGAVPASVVAAALAIALAVPVLGWSLFARPGTAAAQARDNLVRGFDDRSTVSGERTGPGALERLAGWSTPRGTVVRLNRLAGAAGRPAAWPVPRLVAAKLVLGSIAGGLALLVVSNGPSVLTVGMAVAVPLVAYFLPELLLYSRGQERQAAIA